MAFENLLPVIFYYGVLIVLGSLVSAASVSLVYKDEFSILKGFLVMLIFTIMSTVVMVIAGLGVLIFR